MIEELLRDFLASPGGQAALARLVERGLQADRAKAVIEAALAAAAHALGGEGVLAKLTSGKLLDAARGQLGGLRGDGGQGPGPLQSVVERSASEAGADPEAAAGAAREVTPRVLDFFDDFLSREGVSERGDKANRDGGR